MLIDEIRKKMKGIIWFIVIAFVLSIFLIGAAGYFDNQAARARAAEGAADQMAETSAMMRGFQSETPLAVVKMHNTTSTITEGQFQRYLAERGYRDRLASIPEMFRKMMEDQALDELISQRLMVLEGSAQKLDVTTSLEEQIARLRQQTGSEDSFQQFLQQNGFASVEDFKSYLRPQLMLGALGEHLFEAREIQDDEVQVYYQANRENYKGADGQVLPLEQVEAQIREELKSRVDEASMQAYYSRHQARWQKPITADLSFMLVSEQSPKDKESVAASIGATEVEAYYKIASSRFLSPKRAEVADLFLSRESLEKSLSLTDSDAKAYYEEHPEEFQQVAKTRSRHILIRTGSERSKEEALAEITRIRDSILSGEVSFEDAAKEHSQDPGSGANGGDLGFFPKGMMVPPFEKYAFEGPMKEISEPIESSFGYHIIFNEERQEGGLKPFAQAKEDALRLAKAIGVSKKAYEILDDATARIKKRETSFEKLVEELSTGKKENGGVVGIVYLGEGNPEGSLGTLTSGGDEMDPPVLQAISKLKAGEVSEAVETASGFHLLKVNRLLAPERKPLKDVESIIRGELLASRLKAHYEARVKRVQEALDTGQKFEEVALQYNDASVGADQVFSAMEIDPAAEQAAQLVDFGLSSGLGPMQVNSLKYLKAGEISQGISVEPGTIWAKSHKVYPPEYSGFEEVRSEIQEAMTLSVSEQEILEYYRSNPTQFEQAGTFVVQQILYKTQEIAASQLNSILSGGLTIEQAGRSTLNLDRATFNNNDGKISLNDVSFFSVDGQERIKALNPGEVLDTPVQSSYGWHVVKLVEKKEERKLGLIEVREKILEDLRQAKRGEVLMQYLQELRNRAQGIEILKGQA